MFRFIIRPMQSYVQLEKRLEHVIFMERLRRCNDRWSPNNKNSQQRIRKWPWISIAQRFQKNSHKSCSRKITFWWKIWKLLLLFRNFARNLRWGWQKSYQKNKSYL